LSVSVALFGAALDTGNLGVSALALSVIDALAHRIPGVQVSAFDNGIGRREPELLAGGGQLSRYGARRSRRVDREEAFLRIELGCRLGGAGSAPARAILGADAVLDISGGDSFSDIYGQWRFNVICWPKRLALRLGKPLILLPQTYGPFKSEENRESARRLVRASTMAWARDERSFGELRSLLGEDYDEAKHRCGVDVAFLLEAREPRTDVRIDWFEDEAGPVAGVNVSGLLYNDPLGARTKYGFACDYREVIDGLVRGLVADGARVLLIPHVVTPPGHYESDIEASEMVRTGLPKSARDRVRVAPVFEDPREAKWLISKCDWFCGTRMHSTIAALSIGVPTAAIAYSPKTLGVFETCGQGSHVADPMKSEAASVVGQLLGSWRARVAACESLTGALSGVLETAGEQVDSVRMQIVGEVLTR